MTTPLLAPPLPMGWTEHPGPNGQLYYHNAITGEASWVRPLPSFPLPLPIPVPVPLSVQTEKKKKEKPLLKTPIPGTDWIRVKTTEGNTFYTNKAKKESLWVVPDEIKADVQALEEAETAEAVRMKEAEELEASMKRKRKTGGEDELIGEVVVSKKARVEEVHNQDDAMQAGEDDATGDGDSSDSDSEESEMEEWQREAAEQLAKEAAEAEEEKKRRAEEERRELEREDEEKAARLAEGKRKLNIPDKVDISLEEGKVLFKTLLREKDVNPLHPWDTALPLFINDPRYVLLPSVSARREAFDEYCRERARELRQAKVQAESSGAASAAEKGSRAEKDAFDALLREDVTSTRTQWSDWRRKWKKDRRFYGWGRDDREREKRFKEWLKELGEQKRAAAQKAERDFFALLKEQKARITPNSVWKEVKASKELYRDPRYDAVGSSSLREELFGTYLKSLAQAASSAPSDDATDSINDLVSQLVDESEKERLKKEKKERAVKAREEQVRAEMERVDRAIGRSKSGLDREEGERDFTSMLVDAVREPSDKWDNVLSRLEKDPRFTRSQLPLNQKLHLFHAHLASLRSKHLATLHALFETHAPSLATPFSTLPLSLIQASQPAQRLGFGEDVDERDLEAEYDRWQRTRFTAARQAFDVLLAENAFVEFWGRLGKIGGEGVDGATMKEVKVEMDDVGEASVGDEGKVDMKALAKSVDVGEIQKVLRHDKRYTSFDHIPEQRERWIRDYLSQLSAPGRSVHTS